MSGVRASAAAALLAAALALAPASAGAETRQFVNTDQQYPTGGALTEGPSLHYPSTISVDGLAGTVAGVGVTVFLASSANPDDIDMALVGPNGQAVMLLSDSCGAAAVDDVTLVIDDDAQAFAPNGAGCTSFATSTFRPSNYEDPAFDNLGVSGGPLPPYLNALSFLTGGSPNGSWRLYVLDDGAGFSGFSIIGWALTLEVEPPGSADTAAPDTQIGKGPKKKSKKRRARFEFSASEPGGSFQCNLDGAGFVACASPLEQRVERGKHVLEVRAVDAAGNVDPSPAVWNWKVKRPR